MSRVIPNRPAAEKAYRDLTKTFPPGTRVGDRAHPMWRGVVSVDAGRSIRIDRAATRGYQLRIFVAWQDRPPSWVHADDLTLPNQPS